MFDRQVEMLQQAEQQIRDEQDAVLRTEEGRLRPLLKGPRRFQALRQHLVAFAERYESTVVLDPKLYGNSFANLASRRTKLPVRFESDADYAAGVHEQGHLLTACEGPTHYRVKGSGCVACEVGAWEAGIHMALEWTPGMHAELKSALATYDVTTAGTVPARDRMAWLASSSGYREEQLRRSFIELERTKNLVALGGRR